MSSWFGKFAGNSLDPLHIVYKPGAPDDANRDAALAASASAEGTATLDAQQKLAQIYGGSLPDLSRATMLAGDQARQRQDAITAAADNMAAWKPATFDAAAPGVQPQDIRVMEGQGNLQQAATAARAAQLGQQRADLQPVMAGQMGAGPSVAASQQAVALEAARRQAGMQAAAARGGNVGLAARAGILGNMAPQVAVQGAQARGQELASLRQQSGVGQQRLFGGQLGMDQSAQQQEQLRNQQELANRAAAVRHAGLASDAFGQSVRDYKVGGALMKQADTAKLNAYDQTMTDTENAFGSYQDYLRQLYGTSLDTAVKGGQRAAGTLDTILGAQRQKDAANAGLVSTVVGGVMGAVGGGQSDKVNSSAP